MLPHFFRHYDPIVDEYFIWDTGSSDRSLEILRAHPQVRLTTAGPEGASFVEENTARQNEFWKASRGRADWVIITAIDEHLYHPNLRGYLAWCRDQGITLIKAEGYEMVSDEFPLGDEPLHRRITHGKREAEWFDKIQAFDPNKIGEINYEPGRHVANATGVAVFPAQAEAKLLHYKHLGHDYVIARYLMLRTGLREGDIEKRLGSHYFWDRNTLVARHEQIKRHAVKAI